jgi:2'-5' RNA ligase
VVAARVSPQAAERALIVTLKLDEASFDWLQALRTRWFPPERNMVPAHLTLFHNLPGAELDAVRRALREVCARQAPLTLEGSGPRSLGRGVAFGFRSPALEVFRGGLARAWSPWLTPQDRQPFRAHVTVQNKAELAQARALLETLQAQGEPFDALGEGVLLWRYHGGPWEAVDEIAFGG